MSACEEDLRLEPDEAEYQKACLDSESKDEKQSDIESVCWNGSDDAQNPRNWSTTRKWVVCSIALIGTLILPMNGTSITIAAEQINARFGISDAHFANSYWAVTSWSLGGSVFILVALPLMEDFGVRLGYLTFYAFFLLMIIPQALAQNFATLIITRFFSGGCVALLANTIASMIPDLFSDEAARSIPVSIYIFLYVAGNSLGPPVFAGPVQSTGNWRWIFYMQLILYGALFPVFILAIRETRGNVILRRRARHLQRRTGKQVRVRAEVDPAPLWRRLLTSVARPGYLLFTEPVLFACTLWSAFSLGLVFLFTQAVEQVFTGLYGWSTYSAGYVQVAVVIGELLGLFACFYQHRLFMHSASRNTECPGRPIPEARLYMSLVGSLIGMTSGMFVFAWTSYSKISWIAPTIGLAMVGFGVQTVITGVADYVVDAYAASGYAGSAVSAVAAVENVTAAFLPLATQRMYTNLGYQWASTLVGLLSLLLSLAPVLFIWKGQWFRARSPFMIAGAEKARKRERPVLNNEEG